MKDKLIAALLALFLGMFGIHWLYLNEFKKGKSYLIWFIVGVLTCWLLIGLVPLVILSIIAFVDCFKILFMTDEEFDQKYNAPKKPELLNE